VHDGSLFPPPIAGDRPAAKPHHLGHRDRLRERARMGGLAALPDYELLELFLFRSQPQGDVKPIAKALLTRFGSLSAVVGASVTELMTVKAIDSRGKPKSLGRETALDLTALQELSRRIVADPIRKRTVIASWTALLDYVRVALQHEGREQFRVLFLDKKNQLIADEIMGAGTVDHAPVYPREVIKRSLELSACAVILVHNHPSGDPTPSQADIDMTRHIIEAGRVLKITVHDHLVVGSQGVASFRSLGLI
jgi:DNA repair protein RadC